MKAARKAAASGLAVRSRWLCFVGLGGLIGVTALVAATLFAQRALPATLSAPGSSAEARLLDRHGVPIYSGTLESWNVDQQLRLEAMPVLLRESMVLAEDKRYWRHHGPDWLARLSALVQNLRAGQSVRGASTISEQVVRLLNPRPRTVWSRWVEGFEAMRLERRFSKSQILEFYLNQVPYGANRRGAVQAAHYYYGRELETLNPREILSLAVLVRAPSALDPARHPGRIDGAIERLAARSIESGLLDAATFRTATLQLRQSRMPMPGIWAPHFRRAVLMRGRAGLDGKPVLTSLDAGLQKRIQDLAYVRLDDLADRGVTDIAAVVVDLDGNHVRAWVSAHRGARYVDGVDAVTAPRQPGSTLKPLLYAMAFDRGWTPDTEIVDQRLAERVGQGQHVYSNYSGGHYGTVTVREALGNSLNIPAVLALQFVGADRFLSGLRALGMKSLSAHPNLYGDGLALGNGEVTPLELAQAYSAIATNGPYRDLSLIEGETEPAQASVISAPAAGAIRTILRDETSRYLEFGEGSVLRFQHKVAVKTGTSSDYHDAWTVAFDRDFLVVVWAGSLARRETDGVTGAIGPALLVRSILAQLPSRPLAVARAVDIEPSTPRGFDSAAPGAESEVHIRWVQPFDGLSIVIDPRIPIERQTLQFEVRTNHTTAEFTWFVDDQQRALTAQPDWKWSLNPGNHTAQVKATSAESSIKSNIVKFSVK
ncbi:transglycosylase domain-containing protein [Algiphilus sp. W345]|uniref:peptidoglycan glycosyltransferase n=1 Tax=Banduia mediterranea TaxID=3075609 RepID=A0ABU2WEE6_9GAMM|nr:transglycosylase domain-containing protein [Algiphilus sp. W345]MDT0496233.1 transglycosylase domain-containing protein [Algiphilus sp. W345]